MFQELILFPLMPWMRTDLNRIFRWVEPNRLYNVIHFLMSFNFCNQPKLISLPDTVIMQHLCWLTPRSQGFARIVAANAETVCVMLSHWSLILNDTWSHHPNLPMFGCVEIVGNLQHRFQRLWKSRAELRDKQYYVLDPPLGES
jgi:hypothetical protein